MENPTDNGDNEPKKALPERRESAWRPRSALLSDSVSAGDGEQSLHSMDSVSAGAVAGDIEADNSDAQVSTDGNYWSAQGVSFKDEVDEKSMRTSAQMLPKKNPQEDDGLKPIGDDKEWNDKTPTEPLGGSENSSESVWQIWSPRGGFQALRQEYSWQIRSVFHPGALLIGAGLSTGLFLPDQAPNLGECQQEVEDRTGECSNYLDGTTLSDIVEDQLVSQLDEAGGFSGSKLDEEHQKAVSTPIAVHGSLQTALSPQVGDDGINTVEDVAALGFTGTNESLLAGMEVMSRWGCDSLQSDKEAFQDCRETGQNSGYHTMLSVARPALESGSVDTPSKLFETLSSQFGEVPTDRFFTDLVGISPDDAPVVTWDQYNQIEEGLSDELVEDSIQQEIDCPSVAPEYNPDFNAALDMEDATDLPEAAMLNSLLNDSPNDSIAYADLEELELDEEDEITKEDSGEIPDVSHLLERVPKYIVHSDANDRSDLTDELEDAFDELTENWLDSTPSLPEPSEPVAPTVSPGLEALKSKAVDVAHQTKEKVSGWMSRAKNAVSTRAKKAGRGLFGRFGF